MLLEEEKFFYLSGLLSQFGELKRKNHFGGFCLLVDDAIVGLVLDGCFYLRGCLVARSHFEALGFNRLVYSKKVFHWKCGTINFRNKFGMTKFCFSNILSWLTVQLSRN